MNNVNYFKIDKGVTDQKSEIIGYKTNRDKSNIEATSET